MSSTTDDPTDLLFRAVSFAARAHRNQLRKDRETPYVAHVMRVTLVVRHVFGIADPKVLTAAVLHDTIEDTPTDYDDIAERFGTDVALWVALLTKDMRRAEEDREEAYRRTLAAAPWPVTVCKLADIYDNLSDSIHLSLEARERTFTRCAGYLDAMRPTLAPEARPAFEIVERRLAVMRNDVKTFP
jgi:guanosine-3',5'-bis(diphosphate) 3'-pyrophosphohydrolase